MILLIDNYDSFVHNLARHFRLLGRETLVLRNDAIDAHRARQLAPEAIVLSPGPCTPSEAGCSIDLVQRLHAETPFLGICLGHQAIAAAFGGLVRRAERPMHGRSSLIQHTGEGLFDGIPTPLRVGRYHSLSVEEESIPSELSPIARTDSGQLMAIQHTALPVVGVQFHPESILTEHGLRMLANFLTLADTSTSRPTATGANC